MEPKTETKRAMPSTVAAVNAVPLRLPVLDGAAEVRSAAPRPKILRMRSINEG
jgi:hypothetical protein